MNFIKKIFDGEIGEDIHLQFQKFSKGEFRDKALIKAKKTKEKFTINTSAEFANEMVRKVAEKLGEDKTRITGAIISTRNLKEEPIFRDILANSEVKQFQGVRRFIINTEMSGKDIIKFLDECPKAFFALSFDAGDSKLKIKPKAPKSGKPGKGDDKPKVDFCKLITTDAGWGRSFVFEKPDFDNAEINHPFLITELIYPEGEKDFARIRELAKRKGKIIREAKIDGQIIKTEKEFVA